MGQNRGAKKRRLNVKPTKRRASGETTACGLVRMRLQDRFAGRRPEIHKKRRQKGGPKVAPKKWPQKSEAKKVAPKKWHRPAKSAGSRKHVTREDSRWPKNASARRFSARGASPGAGIAGVLGRITHQRNLIVRQG